MKFKSLLVAVILTLGVASSYANVTSNDVKTNEIKTDLVFTSTVSNEVTFTNYDDYCKWYTITTITTHNYFAFGYWIGSSIDTYTEIKCI